MTLLQSFFIAFAMYSAIPVPLFEWNEKNMRHAMAFLPWVGAVSGGAMAAWTAIGRFCGAGAGLGAAVIVALPVAVSGGIHFDGFCDTVDALSSHKSREEKLEILKDSHTGAFAIIMTVFFSILEYGVWQQLWVMESRILWVGCLAPFFIRCLSGITVMLFPSARKKGLAATFAQMAAKRQTAMALAAQATLCGGLMLWFSPAAGFAGIAVSLLWLWQYHHLCMKEFGGMTGDLAGFFLTVGEFLIPAAATLAGMIMG